MHNQNIRLFLYSSLAIVALMIVWGLKTIPKQGELAEKQLRSSLEQELIVLSSAVKASTAAMKFRLLDVLKAEGNDHSTRAFQDSPFVSSALLEWDSTQWKVLWHSSKLKEQIQSSNLREWMREWPLAKISNEEAYFARVADIEGTSYFALVVPVRRPNNTPMLGIGIFAASQFGLTFAADQTREVRVFDSQGFALALGHPAYLGASLKREPLVSEILLGDAVNVRQEWKSDRGIPLIGMASRISDSNLFAAIETSLAFPRSATVQSWIYLVLCAAGAIGVNWFLFASMIRPLFTQLAQTEELVEKMRRQMIESPNLEPVLPVQGETAIPGAQLPDVHFLEATVVGSSPEVGTVEMPPPIKTPLAKIVNAALRSLDSRIQEHDISKNVILAEIDLESDVLQLQTAIEEVLKNAIESMVDSDERQLTITAERVGVNARLTVEDTGSGVKPENINKVFDPFFSTRDSEGVARGLGLNVVRRVIEELDGRVHLVNRPKAGVLVEIEWPLGKSVNVEAEVETKEMKIAASFAVEAEIEAAEDEEFSAVPMTQKSWPSIPIRKPKVRSLD